MLNENISKLKLWLNEYEISFAENYDLRKKSWIKAGGIIKIFITPDTEEKVINLVKHLKNQKIKFYMLGNISNVLIRDGDILTPIINLNKLSEIKNTHNDNQYFSVQAGTSITRFAIYLTKKNISGVQGLVGIPGSLGGGIYMNASSYNSCISDYLTNITAINEKGNLEIIKKEDANFHWRYSIFHKTKKVILKAHFYFPKECIDKKNDLNLSLDKIKNHRKIYQEKNYPNLGSTFATKNIYKDLSKVSLLFLTLYIFHKILSIFFSKFSTRVFLKYRKIIIRIYSILLNVDSKSKFGFSERTLNCIVNYGSNSSNEAILFIKNLHNKIKKTSRLENIILDELE